MLVDGLVRSYYAAFNRGDRAAMLALLTNDVIHDISQGARQTGHEAFAAFLGHMDACYKETVTDLVIMTETSQTRAAAEFTVHGTYIATDGNLPPAKGQVYVISAGAFFAIRDGAIARVSTHYNLPDWIAQVRD